MRELEFLKYLGAIKKPANRTIPLLDIIKLNTGLSAIALPWKSPLNEVLDFHEHPDDLCAQFVQGVAFLHEHKVAHCDLNPKNVVVDTQHQQLFIIDFDLAEFVESEETMVEGWCGTPPWIAPEVGTKDGPQPRYSPILADRWACGRMVKHFVECTPHHARTRQDLAVFAEQLLHNDPRARPPLSTLKFNGVVRK